MLQGFLRLHLPRCSLADEVRLNYPFAIGAMHLCMVGKSYCKQE